MQSRNRIRNQKLFFLTILLLVLLSALLSAAISQPVQASQQPAPLRASDATVSLSIPANVQLGSNFTISATFTNESTDLVDYTGYGPFIDLYIPRGGADGLIDESTTAVPNWGIDDDGVDDNPAIISNPLDGVFPESGTDFTATYLGSNLTVTTITIPDEGNDGRGCVEHPLVIVDNLGTHGEVCGFAGDQLVVIELPFGSFSPDQPPVTVIVPARLSDLADLTTDLDIRARGGFQFGDTPTVDYCCPPFDYSKVSDSGLDGDSWNITAPVFVSPVNTTFSKTNSDGEQPTGPNYPATFTLSLDIPEDQNLTTLEITDTIDSRFTLTGPVSCTPAADTCQITGTDLLVEYSSITGAATTTDVTVEFSYYFDDTILPPASGGSLSISNTANFTATWTPKDTRDNPVSVSDTGIGDGTAVVISASKGSSNITDATLSPDDIIKHTITFDISDYFALENLGIPVDTLSDGQHYYEDVAHFPELTIITNGTTTTVPFTAANYSVTCDYNGAVADGSTECDALDGAPTDGTTDLYFNISGEMISGGVHTSGQLIGGYVPDGNGSTAATSGYVTYYTQIQDSYTDRSGEPSLNSNDQVTNSFSISGDLLDATTCAAGVCTTSITPTATQTDGGSTTQTVPKLSLSKEVYAVNGSICSVTPADCDDISPADTITYRLIYDLVSGDYENLVLTDYLPLPIFHVDDPLEVGAGSHTWTEDTSGGTTPGAGEWMRGPTDTQGAGQGIDPSVTTDGTNNALIFSFGTYADLGNSGYTIDLLFTLTTSDEPYADGLKLTNQIQQSDENTGSQTSSGTEIVQITLSEPVLVGGKSAVASDNPDVADYSAGGVTFLDPGTSGVPWSGGLISSDYLDSNPLNADISGVDGGDLVTFVLVIENTGGSGGFDITLRDRLPGGFVIPPGGMNLQVYNGAGDLIGYDGAEGDLFTGSGVVISDPPTATGACQAHSNTSGENVVLVTYDLMVDPNAVAGQMIENLGELVDYSGSEGGPGHLEEPQDDNSSTTLDMPVLSKTLIGTELDSATNSRTEVVVGELVEYQLRVVLPEGTIEDFRLIDQLAPLSESGLAFVQLDRFDFRSEDSGGVDQGNAAVDIGYTGSDTYAGPPAAPLAITNSGQTLTFNFGTLTNSNADNTLYEVLYIEYTAVVLDIGAIETGDTLQNQATQYYDTYVWNSGTNSYDLVDDVATGPYSGEAVTVIEPTVTITKDVANISPGGTTYDAGDTVQYTFVLENTSSTDAYNITFTDQFPYDSTASTSKLNFPTPNITVVDSAATLTVADFELVDGSGGASTGPWTFRLRPTTNLDMEPGRLITITVDAEIYSIAHPGDLFDNTAYTDWTSLPDTDGTAGSGTDEVNRSTYNADSKERDGSDGIGGAVDDYADSDDADFTTINPGILKTLLSTEIENLNNERLEVVIGELITYQVVLTIPEGELVDAVLFDQLDAQLAFVNVVGITYGSAITAATDPPGLTVTNGGRNIYFDFDQITNSDRDADTTDETVTIQYRALVINNTNAFEGESRRNRAWFYWDYAGSSSYVESRADYVTVREPILEVTKTATNVTKGVDGQYDASDTVRFTITFQHVIGSPVEAYDVNFVDTLPPDGKLLGLNITGVTDSAGVLLPTDFTIDTSGDPDVIRINNPISMFDLGRTVVLTVEGQIYATPYPGEVLTNTANVDWTSLPNTSGAAGSGTDEIDRSTYNTNSDERDGSEGPGGTLNDYADDAVRTVQIEDPGAAKFVFDTDQTHSQDEYLVIGEIVTYAVRITLPESLTPSLDVVDYLPAGLQYVAGSAGFITEAASSKTLLTDDFDYDPTFPIGFASVGTTGTGATGDPQTITFTFNPIKVNNDITVPDTNNSFLLTFEAIVLNDAGNQHGDALENNVSTDINGNVVVGTPVTVNIIEPELTINKTANPMTPSLNGTITYQIVVTNPAAPLPSDPPNAFEVVVTDTLPSGLTLVGGSITNGGTYNGGTRTITWTLGDMATGTTSATLEYQVTVDAYPTNTYTDTHTNNAIVTWSSINGSAPIERDGSGGVNDYTNPDSETTTVTNIDLTLTKDDSVTNVVPGDVLSYTLSYANVGNADSLAAEITETVPDDTTFNQAVSTSGWSCADGSPAGTSCVYTFATGISAGSSGSVTFAVTVNNPAPIGVTQIYNSASIADTDGTNGVDPTPADNTDDDTDTLNATPDIAITKDDGVASANAGDTLVYTLTVYNNGFQDASGVEITETIPDHTNFNAASSSAGWTCLAGGVPGDTCTYTIGALAGGGTSVNVTFALDVFDPWPVGATTVDNTASAADDGTNGTDPTPGDNSDNDVDTINTPSALVKTLTGTDQIETSGTDVAIGEVVSYQIRITLPEGSLTSIQVVDDLLAGLEYVSGTLVVDQAGFDGALPAETLTAPGGSGGNLTIDFGATTVNTDGDDSDNSFTITFDALVLNEAGNQNGSTLTNNVSVALNGGAVTNTDSTDVTVVEPELEISKSADITDPNLDDTISYTINIGHLVSSTEDAYDLVIVDTLPAGLSYVAGSANAGGVYNSGAHTITWNGGDLALSSTLALTYQAELNSSTATPGDVLTNNITLTWTSLDGSETGERTGAGGVDDHNATTSESVTYNTPDLSLTKDDGVIEAAPDDLLSYVLSYANNGSIAATGVVITETVPTYTTFDQAGSGGAGVWSCADNDLAGTICQHTVGTLAAGASGTVSFAVSVDSTVPVTANAVENTASIADDGSNGTDPTPTNNSDADSDTLNAAPDIAITKGDGVNVIAANSTLTYTITVQNLGNQDASGVDLEDTLPAEVSYVSASDNPDAVAAVYHPGTHTVIWDAFDLDSGASVFLTVTVTVNDPLTASFITNSVTANDDGSNGTDVDGSNNTGTDTNYASSLSKSLVGTSELTTIFDPVTGQENVTIGEIVTYEVVFPVPANTTMDSLTLTDTLGEGLAFLDCVGIVTNPTTITTNVSGTDSTDFTSVCANPSVNDIPASDPANPIGNGRQVVFYFADVANGSAVDGTITLQYRAVVLNVPENVNGGNLDNEVETSWGGGSIAVTGTPILKIVEPDMDLTKEVDRNTATRGQIVTYTITVFPTASSTSDGFDVVVNDPIPDGIEYVPGSLTHTSGVVPTFLDDTNPFELFVTWDYFPLGQTSEITFEAEVVESRHNTEVVNVANVAWSSLPGDVSFPQSPHNVTSTERYYDPGDPAGLYTSSAEVSFMTPELPDTGFAPGKITEVPVQSPDMAYNAMEDLHLEVSSLGLYLPIAGIPLENGEWNLSWLWNQAGYLEGTAFPTTNGNAAITSHVYLPNGMPGPFVNLHNLMWGDEIIIHYNGQRYIYQVRENLSVSPHNLSVIDHQDFPWLTLITCQGFDSNSGEYSHRRVVKAVLISVEN